ncbi:MAG: hypothetical protein E6713_11910 [Sporomusaceae bacterium]|nr:hypothetical protein [Sporomusaceae bacterium]
MYKLIIGTVRVTVFDDAIGRDQAASLAKDAIATAGAQNKLLSQVEIHLDESGPSVRTTEKSGCRFTRKSIKQSMLDTIETTVQEKLNPSGNFGNRELWYDNDTGQEWHGSSVNDAREEVLKAFEEWVTSLK